MPAFPPPQLGNERPGLMMSYAKPRELYAKQNEWLVLGWKLVGSAPHWWIRSSRADLPAPDDELVMVPPELIAQHTAILAMSGSGKSYLLGRYLEEVITKTHARCVVFDPNADFRRIYDVDKLVWSKAEFSEKGPLRPLPHEPDGEAFAEDWGRYGKRIFQHGVGNQSFPFEPLGLRLRDISGRFLAADLPSGMHSEVNYAHDFLKAVERYLGEHHDPIHLLTVGERLFRLARIVPENDFITLAEADLTADCDPIIPFIYNAPRYVSESAERAYFGAIRRLISQGMIARRDDSGSLADADVRLRIIDLPSIPAPEDALLASHALLNAEWTRAKDEWSKTISTKKNPTGQSEDNRVPTLLVIDEAHNLAPKDPRSGSAKILLNQVQTIVAEGRKYGLFVVLVSQRPDKLDEVVLSECENVALMRLSGPKTLDDAKRLLNLDFSDATRQELLSLVPGQARIFGKWARNGSESFLCVARRTLQGGTNLRKECWAKPVPRKEDQVS